MRSRPGRSKRWPRAASPAWETCCVRTPSALPCSAMWKSARWAAPACFLPPMPVRASRAKSSTWIADTTLWDSSEGRGQRLDCRGENPRLAASDSNLCNLTSDLTSLITPVTFDKLLTKILGQQAVSLSPMKYPRILCLCAWVTLSLTPCFAHHMAVVVNKDNVVQNFTSAHLAKIFAGEVKKWPDGRNVVLVLHSSSPGEIATLEHLNKMTEAEVKALLASHKDSIRTVGSDADVIDAVASTPGAIGFIEEHSITDRVVVVKVDGKLPMEAGYLPHSPRASS